MSISYITLSTSAFIFGVLMWGFANNNKMLEEDALRTIDCLRGRLQAERAASRAVQLNAQLMIQKLKELEKQLKVEAKSRRKAEKKLNFLKKKLESLNIPLNITPILEEFEGSISSNNSEISCMSSFASTSLNNNQQNEDILLDSQVASKSSSITSEITEERESESNVEHKVIQDISKHDRSATDPITRGQHSDEFYHGFNESTLEKNVENENKNQDDVDKMALVPVTSIVEVHASSDKHLEVKSVKVREILNTLKHIRENLQHSLEKMRITKVG